jgi:hypothetical protein
MSKSSQIQIPIKPFALFIKAASKWLAENTEVKTGLELRLAAEGPDLHVSVGANSSYLEALLVADVSLLTEPIFLDMSYLSNYPFDSEPLILIKPEVGRNTENKDKRAQFKAPSQNFRIPIRSGDAWERNHQDLEQFKETQGFFLTQELMSEVYPNLDLPDSFGQKKKVPQRVAFEKLEGNQFQAYSEDDFGALWHKFKSDDFQSLNDFQKIVVMYDFFIPYAQVPGYTGIILKQSNRLTIGELKINKGGFKRFRWMQPNHTKTMGNIPVDATKVREKVSTCLTFDADDFTKKVEQAIIFYRGEKELQDMPLEFSIIQDSYTLSARLQSSEMQIEGKTKEPVPSPLRINFQAACLRDYLKCLKKKETLHMEIFPQSVILYQQKENQSLLYWMPTRSTR